MPKNLIPASRIEDKDLQFTDHSVTAVNGRLSYSSMEICRSTGGIYDEPYWKMKALSTMAVAIWNDAAAFERFQPPVESRYCGRRSGPHYYQIVADQGGEIYLLKSRKNGPGTDFVSHLASAKALDEVI